MEESFFRSNYVVVDFETTGLTEKDWPISMGWTIITKDGRILQSNQLLIKLPLKARLRYYSGEAFEIHRIHWKTARRLGVSPEAALHIFYESLDNIPDPYPIEKKYKFAAHNVAFDWKFFRKLHAMAGWRRTLLGYHLVDIPTLGHALLGISGSKKLSEALGVTNKAPHVARLDALMSAQMLVKLLILEKTRRQAAEPAGGADEVYPYVDFENGEKLPVS